MDPLNNYCQILFNILLFFFVFCLSSAEAACPPKNPYLTYLFPSPAPDCQPSVRPSKPTPPSAIPALSLPSSNLKPRLRQIFPSSLQPPVASPRPQNSAPTASFPSPSYLSSFFPRPLSGSTKTSPRSNLFMQSRQLSAASSPSPAAVDPAAKQLCNNTNYTDLCISSILPFLSARGKTSIDAITMLQMVIKACSIHAQMALAAASKYSTEPNNAHRTTMAIMECKDMYSEALDGLQTALDAIPDKDIATINTMLSGVISDAQTCEDGFEGHKSPLSDFDDKLRKMGSNCLAIASLIKW
ncbi:putative pectinesterase inhibitor domain-containing protein [Rosa chinensis]|uniref:Putative pectinesterase inhibitor domain-containing protein n=1 Tax=Rosa chinensis TaxID=74649 RepID=A0A2P6QYZ5_ROSCH|nr:pectinesterase inhibitor 6 [Rosa chinensis]PRQ39407.1 putative pectinesterase inhibitor domain-containing protein [Rosa chinensis]